MNRRLYLHLCAWVFVPTTRNPGSIRPAVHAHSLLSRKQDNATGFKVDVVEQVTREHLAILDALKERNADKAAAATLEHLINGEARTLKTLSQVTELQNSLLLQKGAMSYEQNN